MFGPELVYLLYPKSVKELKRKISQVSTEPNSPLNATSAASANEDTTSNAEIQTNEQKFSLITPEMDAAYLAAVAAEAVEKGAKTEEDDASLDGQHDAKEGTIVDESQGVRHSLQGAVADILDDYDTDGVEYSSVSDIADGIETLIAESTENTTELENILNDFRYAQDDARNWGNRMDSGGEEEFEEALRMFANKSTLGERNGADSHNSSSEGLPLESSERLSGNALASPKDVAKIGKNTEVTHRAAKNIINEGGLKKKIKTPAQAVSALGKGLHMEKSDNSQSYYGDFFEGDYIVDERVVHIRISTHPATPTRMGNADADHKVSIVIRKNGKHKSDGTPHNGYTEYTYDPSVIAPKDAANAVIKGVKTLLETGEYIDETGKAVRKDYPYTDKSGKTLYSLITPEMDAAYMDAVNNGDMETAQRMVMEAAEKAGYINDESWRMNHRAPRKDEENANPFNTERIVPEDFWEHPEWYTNIRHSSETRESYYAMKRAIDKYKRLMAEGKTDEADNVTITMYRGVDKTANKREASFRNGDWITPSRSYALSSAPYGKARVISQEVNLKDIWWDGNSINEWGYDDGANYGYRDTKNNRKLLDPVTYDDNGNVIPLSERFNPKKEDIRYSLQETNDRFNAELAALTEDNARERIFDLGRPSYILLSTGIEDKPIRLYGAKLLSKLRKHGYDISALKNLPLAINLPIAVFKGSHEGSFAILTELKIKNNNILAALSVGKGGHDIDFNIISSVYDKRGDSVARWVTDGKMLYADKKKALDYFSVSAPVAEAQNNQELVSVTNIIQNFENPKVLPRFSLMGKMGAGKVITHANGDVDAIINEQTGQARLSLQCVDVSIMEHAEYIKKWLWGTRRYVCGQQVVLAGLFINLRYVV